MDEAYLQMCMKLRLKHAVIFAGCLLCRTESPAQVVVSNTMTAAQIVQSLVGQGLTVSNVTVNCPTDAYGWFDGTASNLGIDSGLVMTSGSIFEVPGPNTSSGAGIDNSAPGDAQLDLLSTFSTYDACIIEFDLAPDGDTIRFRYVFGSEEYHEFVCDIYNDVFAFFISGPGIVGSQNIALVPGTATPVAINNVNNGYGFYGSGTPCTTPGGNNCPCNPGYFFDNEVPAGLTVQYDGFTYVLTAEVAVTSCETYHLKIAIGDAGDGVLDSGVFLEQRSLTSSIYTLLAGNSAATPSPYAIEDCINGVFTVSLSQPAANPVTVHYIISGSAVNGADYTWIPDSVTIPAGSDSANIIIAVSDDGIAETGDSVVIYLIHPCSGMIIDSAVIWINDNAALAGAGADTLICEEGTAAIGTTAAGNLTYAWTPPTGLSDPSAASTTANPSTTTQYVLTVRDTMGCTDTDTVTVTVSALPVDAGPGDTITIGESATLHAGGAYQYAWTSSDALLPCAGCTDPVVTPQQTTTYYLAGSDTFGCTGLDSVTIVVMPVCTVFVPNAFTPNNDGRNETFNVVIPPVCVQSATLRLYNRWGEEIFTTADLSQGWDGHYKGREAPEGVYVWMLEGAFVDGQRILPGGKERGVFLLLK